MTARDVTFKLAPVYKKLGIEYKQAKATAIFPEGDAGNPRPFVAVEYTSADKSGQTGKVEFDYQVNATGPRLNFGATEGLSTEGFSESVCTNLHAGHA
jgi:sulfide:quinone oxidoreductase